jgi:hypothetical protein
MSYGISPVGEISNDGYIDKAVDVRTVADDILITQETDRRAGSRQ